MFFQIAGLTVSLFVLTIWIRQKKMGLLKDRVLFVAIIICVLMQMFDLTARIFIFNELSKNISQIISKAFIVSTIAETLMVSLYFIFDTIREEKQYMLLYLSLALIAVCICLTIVLNVGTVKLESYALISGPAYSLSYFICWALALIMLVSVILFRKNRTTLHLIAIIGWCVSVLAGTIVNFIFDYILCESFAFAIALIAVTSLEENLEGTFNSDLEIFQYDSLITYLKLRYAAKSELSMVYVYTFNDNNEYRKDVVINEMLNGASKIAREKTRSRVFKIRRNELVVCSDDLKTTFDLTNELKKYIDSYQLELNFASRSDSAIVYVENIHLAESPVDLMNLLANSRLQVNKNPLNTDIIRIDNDLVEKIKDETNMLKEIDYALENNGVVLTYQPVYSVKKDKIVSAEVLTRLRSKAGEIILPNKFIPVAEKYGRIEALGEEILNESCLFYKELKEMNLALDDISVNFSSYQLERPAIINSVIDAISNNNIYPSSLCIEITSAHSVRRKEDYLKSINRLVSFGVNLSLTGYGSDESNLDYITGAPANLIRFDRQYVWNALTDERAKKILDSTIDMIHSFRMEVVAVGVETQEQFDALKDSSVDYLQGILISKPLGKEDLINFLKAKVSE